MASLGRLRIQPDVPVHRVRRPIRVPVDVDVGAESIVPCWGRHGAAAILPSPAVDGLMLSKKECNLVGGVSMFGPLGNHALMMEGAHDVVRQTFGEACMVLLPGATLPDGTMLLCTSVWHRVKAAHFLVVPTAAAGVPLETMEVVAEARDFPLSSWSVCIRAAAEPREHNSNADDGGGRHRTLAGDMGAQVVAEVLGWYAEFDCEERPERERMHAALFLAELHSWDEEAGDEPPTLDDILDDCDMDRLFQIKRALEAGRTAGPWNSEASYTFSYTLTERSVDIEVESRRCKEGSDIDGDGDYDENKHVSPTPVHSAGQ